MKQSKKIKVYKKNISLKKDKLAFYNWLMYNSTDKNITNLTNPDLSFLYSNSKILSAFPKETEEIILKASKKTFIYKNIIVSLVFLSNGNFNAKKSFEKLFFLLIKNLDHFYTFFYYTDKIRGFGQLIRKVSIHWLKTYSAKSLDKENFFHFSKYGWTLKKVLKKIHPNPESKEKQELFYFINNSSKNNQNFLYTDLLHSFSTNSISEESAIKSIQKYSIKNKDLPGNFIRTKKIRKELLKNESAKNFFLRLSKEINFLKESELIELMNSLEISNKDVFYMFLAFNYLLKSKNLLTNLLLELEDKLRNYICNKYFNDNVHVVDNDEKLFDKKIMGVETAKIASFFSKTGEIAYSMNGKILNSESDFFSIIEAEEFTDDKYYFDQYRLVSNILFQKSYTNDIILWAKNGVRVNSFVKNFYKFENNNSLIIINLGNSKLKIKNKRDNVFVFQNFDRKTKLFIERNNYV